MSKRKTKEQRERVAYYAALHAGEIADRRKRDAERAAEREPAEARALKWAREPEFRRATWEAAQAEARESWHNFPAVIPAGYAGEAHALAERIRAAAPFAPVGSAEWRAINCAQACAAWLIPPGACGYQAAAVDVRAELITETAAHAALFAALAALERAEARCAELENTLHRLRAI